MKTNHRRGFKAELYNVFSKYVTVSVKRTALDGTLVGASASSGDHTNGKRGIRRDRAGAKKFVHSRIRRRDRDELKRIVNHSD